eukprot:TRINITY_DN13632_c0_g1_i2.p1 TRINITY_DN13632_c0_g1~~TRINITY_DN13632_c0_g1_i2.p1  ORF type:complete len:116 (-),score=15.08 TRINITY_DN13632_c0_g1_i2:105-452(-)
MGKADTQKHSGSGSPTGNLKTIVSTPRAILAVRKSHDLSSQLVRPKIEGFFNPSRKASPGVVRRVDLSVTLQATNVSVANTPDISRRKGLPTNSSKFLTTGAPKRELKRPMGRKN